MLDRIDRDIQFSGPLTTEQKQSLDIAPYARFALR
jgi:hypothetical protein